MNRQESADGIVPAEKKMLGRPEHEDEDKEGMYMRLQLTQNIRKEPLLNKGDESHWGSRGCGVLA